MIGWVTHLIWPAQDLAVRYEVSRSDRPDLAVGCSRFRTSDTFWVDTDEPPLGAVFHYLVQPTSPFAGSLGVDSFGAERALVCGAENDCDDGLDDDGDGRTDCNDPNCLGKAGCATVATFTDTPFDDVPTTWLEEFFEQLFVQPEDYLYLRIGDGGIETFELCVARADFYRDSYLLLAPIGGETSSGAWEKWYRGSGGTWTGPVTASFENLYGGSCAEVYSWCTELGLGGQTPGVAPWETGICENFNYITCGDGSASYTIRVGASRCAADEGGGGRAGGGA